MSTKNLLLAITMLLAMGISFNSCTGKSKNGVEEADSNVQGAEKNDRESTLENINNTLSSFSYTLYRYEWVENINVFVDDDGHMKVIRKGKDQHWDYSFSLYDERNVYYNGQPVPYDPKLTASDISPFIMQEILFILTKYSLEGDPTVKSRKDIDISQYLYYLVFNNKDANDFVKEKVSLHYDVAMEQILDEINNVQEYKTNSAGRFKFIYTPSNYNKQFKIELYFDKDGNMVVSTSPVV